MGRILTFDLIFKTHFVYVIRLARLFGVPARDLEDVAQEVFITLNRAIKVGRFDLSALPKPWLRTISYRIARDYRVALNHQGLPSLLAGGGPLDESLQGNSERGVALREEWAMLIEMLSGLGYEQRAVFVLHEVEQLSPAEIAEELSISVNTVTSRLRAARADFEAALRRSRATERRTTRGAGALLLPFGADSIMRLARSLPGLEGAPGAQERVLARVQEDIGLRTPMALGRPRLPIPRGAFKVALHTGIAFVAGMVAGAAGLDALQSPLPPPVRPPESIPIWTVTVASAGGIPVNLAAALTSAAVNSAIVSTTPTGSPPQPPPSADTPEEAVRQCINAARAKLAPGASDPAAALRMLARCEERYPTRLFPDVREHIRQEAREALAEAGQKP